jgi:hypothetical protein
MSLDQPGQNTRIKIRNGIGVASLCHVFPHLRFLLAMRGPCLESHRQSKSFLALLLPVLLQLDRGQMAKRTVTTFMIVFATPALEENLSFEQ